MARNMVTAALAVIAITALTGCYNPKIDDAHLILTPDEQKVAEKGVLVPGAAEVDAVEQVAAARSGYQTALEELIAYYKSAGNAAKTRWAQNELTTLKQTAQYRYLSPGEYVTQDMKAVEKIEGAEELYKRAQNLYFEAGAYFIITNEAKLRQSLQLFNQLMKEYPNSNRLDEAAYKTGRIYEHFKDYELAAVMYQRCFQWNENTSFPARFRAAYLLDQRLKMSKEAVAIYKLSVKKEARYEDNTEFATRRILELSKADPSLQQEAGNVLQK